MDALERRVDWLDEHGTRAVGALQLQVSELIKDAGKMEGVLNGFGTKIDKVSAGRWVTFWSILACLVPLYALVIAVLLQHVG